MPTVNLGLIYANTAHLAQMTTVEHALASLDAVVNAGLDALDDPSARGLVILGSLPTVDPEVVGALWNDGGFMMISAGPVVP